VAQSCAGSHGRRKVAHPVEKRNDGRTLFGSAQGDLIAQKYDIRAKINWRPASAEPSIGLPLFLDAD
jgi:hypothetical protein